jgi:hypothetical protein
VRARGWRGGAVCRVRARRAGCSVCCWRQGAPPAARATAPPLTHTAPMPCPPTPLQPVMPGVRRAT